MKPTEYLKLRDEVAAAWRAAEQAQRHARDLTYRLQGVEVQVTINDRLQTFKRVVSYTSLKGDECFWLNLGSTYTDKQSPNKDVEDAIQKEAREAENAKGENAS